MSRTTRHVLVRRRAAALAGALVTAVAGAAISTSPVAAEVGKVTGASPAGASNASTATGPGCPAAEELIRFTHTTPFPESGTRTPLRTPGEGTQVELVRSDTAGTDDEDTHVGDVVENPADTDPLSTAACFRFGPGSDGTSSPANPGRYDVHIYVRDRRAGDMCSGCFSVFSGPPTVTLIAPNELPADVQGQTWKVVGTNFAESTVVEALLPGTSVVDPTVSFSPAKEPLVAGQVPLDKSNTATELPRTIRVDASAPPGFRDIRVTNTDRQTVTVPGGLRITAILIERIDPPAAGNTSVQRATITGRGLQPGSVPSLVDESPGAPAPIVGTNVVRSADGRLTADFDLRNARPGEYRVHVRAPDGSASTPECSPIYTVVDTAGGAGGRSTVRASDFTCERAGDPNPGPPPSGSPTATPSGTPAPTATSTPTSNPTPSRTSASTPTATAPSSAAPGAARYAGLASPVRVLDTRAESGARRTGEIVLDLSSHVTDPNATAVVLNVTVTNASERGFVVAHPHGTPRPGTSNVNVNPGQTQANEVVVGLSSAKRVSLYVDSARAHVIADLVGAFTTSAGGGAGRVTTTAPARAFDSRTTQTPLRRGEVVLDLRPQLPEGSTDAILNVTVTQPTGRGFVTVFPTGTERPGTSNVNVEAGQTQANEVVTRLGTGSNAGQVSLFVDSTDAALIVDVVGAVTAEGGQAFTVLDRPTRALDTREERGSRRTGEVEVAMPAGVPGNATGVILNVTATNGSRPGFVTVFPAGSSNPGTSNVNFPGEQPARDGAPASAGTQANEVLTALGPNRRVTLSVGGANDPRVHLIVDVVGYLTP